MWFRLAIGSVLLASVMLDGCHAWPVEEPSPVWDNARFMAAWKTYRHCRVSTKPDEIQADLEQLHDAVYAVTDQVAPPSLLPEAIRSLIMPLPSRLAVDPFAMTMACAVHGSEVAQTAGLHEARDLFMRTMVANRRLFDPRRGGTRLVLPGSP